MSLYAPPVSAAAPGVRGDANVFVVAGPFGEGGSYATIQQAVDAAVAGSDEQADVILIKPGHYEESVVVADDDGGEDVRIALVGARARHAEHVTIDPPDGSGITVTADVHSVRIAHLTTTGGTGVGGGPPMPGQPPDPSGSGIVVLGGDVLLDNVASCDNDLYGLFALGTRSLEVSDAEFYGNGVNGIGVLSTLEVTPQTVELHRVKSTGNGIAGIGVIARDLLVSHSAFNANGFTSPIPGRGFGLAIIDVQTARLRRVTANGNAVDGAQVSTSPTLVDVSHSVFNDNGDDGIELNLLEGSPTRAQVTRTVASRNVDHGVEVRNAETVELLLSRFKRNAKRGDRVDVVLEDVEQVDEILVKGNVVGP